MSKQVSPKRFLEIELEMGVSPANPRFVSLANATAAQLAEFVGMSVIDYGAGVGTYAKSMVEAGFKVTAQDVWKEHRDFIKKAYPDLKVVDKPIKADLMLFIEVAEHMTDEEIETALLIIDPEIILFSSTPNTSETDEEWGHINIKSEDDWLEFWAFAGYKLLRRIKKPTKWSMILKRI